MIRRMFGARWNGERGFTLAEVLIATFVLTIGLVAVMTGFQYAASGVETGKGETQALFLAEQRVEQLKNQAIRDFTATSGCAAPLPTTCLAAVGTTTENYNTITTITGALLPYRRDTTIVDNPGAPCATNCKMVTVSVFYKPITGRGDLSQERRVDVVVLLVPRT